MGNKSFYQKFFSVTKAVVLLGVTLTLVIPSGAEFEARNGGSSYSVPAPSSSYGISGGGYSTGDVGYVAPAILSSNMYKYQKHPAMKMQSNGWGWGGGNDDDDDLDFPVELIGLLGLKGLKGLKGLTGLLGLLPGLLLLKKLLAIPLLVLLLPLLIPLFLLKLLLILLIPVPVITTTAGRNLVESEQKWISFQKFWNDKLESFMSNLPQDVNQIVNNVKGSSAWE